MYLSLTVYILAPKSLVGSSINRYSMITVSFLSILIPKLITIAAQVDHKWLPKIIMKATQINYRWIPTLTTGLPNLITECYQVDNRGLSKFIMCDYLN